MEKELENVRKLIDKVPHANLITCNPRHVRIEISKTKAKTVVVIIHFPQHYPQEPLLLEIRTTSSALNDKAFTNGLAKVCEDEVRKYAGEPQILRVAEFVSKFIVENPLSSCYDEIVLIRKELLKHSDELKLKQKLSVITLKVMEENYLYKVDAKIPDNYPETKIIFEQRDSNFPKNLIVYMTANLNEIARRCVDIPLNKKTGGVGVFEAKPSLLEAFRFLVEVAHRFPKENCFVCKKRCFPEVPEQVIQNEADDLHVERTYCNHLVHLKCLLDYMKTPPFKGGKKCLVCHQKIFHEKYKVTPELSEARWAHGEAKKRELDDVTDFLS